MIVIAASTICSRRRAANSVDGTSARLGVGAAWTLRSADRVMFAGPVGLFGWYPSPVGLISSTAFSIQLVRLGNLARSGNPWQACRTGKSYTTGETGPDNYTEEDPDV